MPVKDKSKKYKLKELLERADRTRPLSRFNASAMLGVDDRTVRDLIQTLRCEGVRVCADSSSHGDYWIAKTDAEYKRFRAECISRATKILDTVKAMDEAVEGQICL